MYSRHSKKKFTPNLSASRRRENVDAKNEVCVSNMPSTCTNTTTSEATETAAMQSMIVNKEEQSLIEDQETTIDLVSSQESMTSLDINEKSPLKCKDNRAGKLNDVKTSAEGTKELVLTKNQPSIMRKLKARPKPNIFGKRVNQGNLEKKRELTCSSPKVLAVEAKQVVDAETSTENGGKTPMNTTETAAMQSMIVNKEEQSLIEDQETTIDLVSSQESMIPVVNSAKASGLGSAVTGKPIQLKGFRVNDKKWAKVLVRPTVTVKDLACSNKVPVSIAKQLLDSAVKTEEPGPIVNAPTENVSATCELDSAKSNIIKCSTISDEIQPTSSLPDVAANVHTPTENVSATCELDSAKNNIIKCSTISDEIQPTSSLPDVAANVHSAKKNFKIKVARQVMCEGKQTWRMKIRYDNDSQTTFNPEQYQRRREKLQKRFGGSFNKDICDEDIRIKFDIDSSDESTASEGPILIESSPASSKHSSTLKSSPASKNSRSINMKPNLKRKINRLPPVNHLTFGQMNHETKSKLQTLFGNRSPDRSKMSMKDFIFYNPKSNPLCKPNDEETKTTSSINTESDENHNTSPMTSEECLSGSDSDQEPIPPSKTQVLDKNGLPVPQLKLTADGKVIIAPESLIVESSNQRITDKSEPVIMEDDLTYHKVNKKTTSSPGKKTWSFQETLKFYRNLYENGSDFSCMQESFSDRSRACLKRKFKREERIHGDLIDRILKGSKLSEEQYKSIEKELAIEKTLEIAERSCKSKSDKFPKLFDYSKGVTKDLYLTKSEKQSANIKNTACRNLREKCTKGRRKRPKILRLREYLMEHDPQPPHQSIVPEVELPETVDLVSDSDKKETVTNQETAKETNIPEISSENKPIKVNTKIESSGLKYTKCITFNPSNLEIPIDVNETICHENGQDSPNSNDIITEIVSILSSDGQSAPTFDNYTDNA